MSTETYFKSPCGICGVLVSNNGLGASSHRRMHERKGELPDGICGYHCDCIGHNHFTRLSRDRCVNHLVVMSMCSRCAGSPCTIHKDFLFCWSCLHTLGLPIIYNFRFQTELVGKS